MITEENVKEILKTCYDPELSISVVDLGLIYEIKVDNDKKTIAIKMTFTSPGCPLTGQMAGDVKDKVEKGTGFSTHVEIVWEPIWTINMMSEEAKTAIGL
ncbi:MAG: metal-sulfur cluster assembly factor [Candidatus Aenigmatarchaeota archaeon]